MTEEKKTEIKTTTLDETLKLIQAKLGEVEMATMKRVLPGARRYIVMPLREAHKLLGTVQELMDRSGQGQKLGFVVTPEGVQPGMVIPTKADGEVSDATE